MSESKAQFVAKIKSGLELRKRERNEEVAARFELDAYTGYRFDKERRIAMAAKKRMYGWG